MLLLYAIFIGVLNAQDDDCPEWCGDPREELDIWTDDPKIWRCELPLVKVTPCSNLATISCHRLDDLGGDLYLMISPDSPDKIGIDPDYLAKGRVDMLSTEIVCRSGRWRLPQQHIRMTHVLCDQFILDHQKAQSSPYKPQPLPTDNMSTLAMNQQDELQTMTSAEVEDISTTTGAPESESTLTDEMLDTTSALQSQPTPMTFENTTVAEFESTFMEEVPSTETTIEVSLTSPSMATPTTLNSVTTSTAAAKSSPLVQITSPFTASFATTAALIDASSTHSFGSTASLTSATSASLSSTSPSSNSPKTTVFMPATELPIKILPPLPATSVVPSKTMVHPSTTSHEDNLPPNEDLYETAILPLMKQRPQKKWSRISHKTVRRPAHVLKMVRLIATEGPPTARTLSKQGMPLRAHPLRKPKLMKNVSQKAMQVQRARRIYHRRRLLPRQSKTLPRTTKKVRRSRKGAPVKRRVTSSTEPFRRQLSRHSEDRKSGMP